MIIKNEGKEFKIEYNAKEFTIPTGEMDINDNGFATFILSKARKWGLIVSKVRASNELAVKPIEQITQDVISEIKDDEIIEEQVIVESDVKESVNIEDKKEEEVKEEKGDKKNKTAKIKK